MFLFHLIFTQLFVVAFFGGGIHRHQDSGGGAASRQLDYQRIESKNSVIYQLSNKIKCSFSYFSMLMLPNNQRC
jgi:hypothetical protein